MSHSRDYETEVVTVAPETSCFDVADLLDARTVGCVVVVDKGHAVGIVTDRDLVCRVIAADRDPEKTTAGDVMTRNLVTGSHDDNLEDLLQRMKKHSIRRVPLLENGKLVGLISLDDLLTQLSSFLFNASQGVLGGLHESRRTVRHRRRLEAREDALEELRGQLSDLRGQARRGIRRRLEDLLERFHDDA
jgi:CBS domain-containing protein